MQGASISYLSLGSLAARRVQQLPESGQPDRKEGPAATWVAATWQQWASSSYTWVSAGFQQGWSSSYLGLGCLAARRVQQLPESGQPGSKEGPAATWAWEAWQQGGSSSYLRFGSIAARRVQLLPESGQQGWPSSYLSLGSLAARSVQLPASSSSAFLAPTKCSKSSSTSDTGPLLK